MTTPLDFRAVFDASPNAYMLLDRELRYVYANRVYLQLTGSDLASLVGRHVFDLFPNDPDDPNNRSARLLRESFEKVLQTKHRDVIAFLPYSVAEVLGGKPVVRLWSASHEPVLDDDGEVAFILQQTTEVTGLGDATHPQLDSSDPLNQTALSLLRRAELTTESNRALGDQLTDLRNLFEQAPGFVCFLRGPEHVFEMANRAYNALVGQRALIGKPIREALPDLAGQGYFELLDEVIRTGQPFIGQNMHVQLERKDGLDEVVLDFIYQPILAANGSVSGVLVQGQDVTEHRRHESRQRFLTRAGECLAHAIRDLEGALEKLARAAVPDFADWALLDLYEAGRYRRLCAIGPEPGSEQLGELARTYPPSAQQDSAWARALAAPTATWIERVSDDARQQIAQNPQHLALMQQLDLRSLLVVPLIMGTQHIGAFTFGLASLRRYAQSDLAVAEELVRITAIALDNARLSRERAELLKSEQAARERAEAANQAKDEFLAMLGHELRNPLAPILTAIELMKLRESEVSREQVIIERQAQHLVRLVDDLLDVSRIARGKVQLKAAPTNLATAVTAAVEIASPLLEQRRHELQLELPRTPLLVYGDEARLSQIIANLLTNAARYTEREGRIELRAELVGSEIVLRVRDNGVGITPELLPRIFDMFVQGPQHSDRATGGLGLGLTLVRNLVDMHGGSVEAHSGGKDQGSEFTIRLPALQATAADTPAAAGEPEPAPSSGARVLVVDDNVDAAELLGLLLENRGYETALAHDGPSALQEAARFKPTVAVLDIGLPVMDGYELAAQLRAQCGPDTPRLIALTGYGQAYDHQRSRDAGFYAHLVKPVDSEVLFRAVSGT
ncbi:MAG: ATP-binding protein [Polyangiales bacterium]